MEEKQDKTIDSKPPYLRGPCITNSNNHFMIMKKELLSDNMLYYELTM